MTLPVFEKTVFILPLPSVREHFKLPQTSTNVCIDIPFRERTTIEILFQLAILLSNHCLILSFLLFSFFKFNSGKKIYQAAGLIRLFQGSSK